jgi:hypothetical protein
VVQVGAAKHEIGAGLADFCAIYHQAKMRRLGMLAPGLETVVHRHFQANVVTVEACFDALLQFWIS